MGASAGRIGAGAWCGFVMVVCVDSAGLRLTPRRIDAFGYLICKDRVEKDWNGYSVEEMSEGLITMVIVCTIGSNCLDNDARNVGWRLNIEQLNARLKVKKATTLLCGCTGKRDRLGYKRCYSPALSCVTPFWRSWIISG